MRQPGFRTTESGFLATVGNWPEDRSVGKDQGTAEQRPKSTPGDRRLQHRRAVDQREVIGRPQAFDEAEQSTFDELDRREAERRLDGEAVIP